MEIFIYLIGGILAGVATGLIGLSAATIIAPLFATMLGMDVYLAIGIALASDVFASASSAGNYIKNKNIDIKNSAVLAVCVVSFTIIGSYLSKDMNPYNLNGTINIMVLLLGLRFIIFPVKKNENPKFICFISSLSKSAQTALNMFKEKSIVKVLGSGNSIPEYVPDESYFAMINAALDPDG